MICVTSIELVDVERDFLERAMYENMPPLAQVINAEEPTRAEVKTEMIRGRVFINANRQEFCIGMPKEVQDAIGLPMEAFNNMSNVLDRLQRYSTEQTILINSFKNAKWWKRLKYFFTGKF